VNEEAGLCKGSTSSTYGAIFHEVSRSPPAALTGAFERPGVSETSMAGDESTGVIECRIVPNSYRGLFIVILREKYKNVKWTETVGFT